MKRPLSPSHSPESGLRLVEAAGCPPGQPEQRMKREKKHQSFTLCEVCNIQLNSAAQAQIHYNGKSHQKRLKQLNKGKVPAAQGRSRPSGQSCPKAALARGQVLRWAWRAGFRGCSGMLGCVLGVCHLLVCLSSGGFPTPLSLMVLQVILGPESPWCCLDGWARAGPVHGQVRHWYSVTS